MKTWMLYLAVVVLILGSQVAACATCRGKGGVWLGRELMCVRGVEVIR